MNMSIGKKRPISQFRMFEKPKILVVFLLRAQDGKARHKEIRILVMKVLFW
jgi:hypothetical protein